MAVRQLRDPDLRRLRALRMIEMRIKGKTMKEVADEFGVSTDTVERTLSWAKKAELVVEAEDKILRDLVPAAHKAISDVLAGTNDEVKARTALEIFKGTLPSFAKKPTVKGNASHDAQSDLSSYIDTLRNGLIADGEVLGGEAALPERGAQRQITAGAPGAPSEGLPVAAAGHESPVEP
jgi:hypothetical protein